VKSKDNDASHENGAESRRQAIGTDEQSDASRSQAPQGAGDETGMAWCTETTPPSAVAQVTEDGGGVDSIPVGIGRVKAKGANSKVGAKGNTMALTQPVLSACSVSGCSSPQVWRMVSIFSRICAVGSV